MLTRRLVSTIGVSIALATGIAPTLLAQSAPPPPPPSDRPAPDGKDEPGGPGGREGGPGGPGGREGGPGGPGGREGGPGGPGGPGGQRGGRGAGAPTVDGAMKGMNRALKQLTGSIGDATKKQDNLRLISDMQRNCAIAKSLPVPADVLKSAADDAAKAKLEGTYRTDMRRTLRLLLDLEDAVADGKIEAAKTLLAKLEAARDSAHKELGVKDD